MPKKWKPKIRLDFKIKQQIYEDLKTVCKETGLGKNFIIEQALKQYLAQYHFRQKAGVPNVTLEEYCGKLKEREWKIEN